MTKNRILVKNRFSQAFLSLPYLLLGIDEYKKPISFLQTEIFLFDQLVDVLITDPFNQEAFNNLPLPRNLDEPANDIMSLCSASEKLKNAREVIKRIKQDSLAKDDENPGRRWGIPKGSPKANEEFFDTAKREFTEETFIILPTDFSPKYTEEFRLGVHSTTVYFWSVGANVDNIENKDFTYEENREIESRMWFTYDDAMQTLVGTRDKRAGSSIPFPKNAIDFYEKKSTLEEIELLGHQLECTL